MSALTDMNSSMRIAAIKKALAHHPDLIKILITDDGSINPSATPEKLQLTDPADTLARVARDIWNGSGGAEFGEMINILNSDDYNALIDALIEYGKLRDRISAVHAARQQND